MHNIIILDDEIGICSSLTASLEDKYGVQAFTEPELALNEIKNKTYDVCLLDLRIGNINGLNILNKIKKIDKNIVVIIMTAYGSIETTIEAIKNGAYNYLTKPLNIKELYIAIEKAIEYRCLNQEVEYLSKKLTDRYKYQGIIGKSKTMKEIYDLIEKIKDANINIFIYGESGTGKELIAKALHYSGKRKNSRFEAVNCASIPEGLLEEELFGHTKGSFTGAISDRKGKFEYANKGTIFLDEIGDLPYNLQAKLLRILEEKKISPIGSNEKIELDIRVISATNKDIKKLIDEKKFRKDLYYRLNVVEIKLPPLKERKQDLPLLINYFIKKYNEKLNKNIKGLSRKVENILLRYSYPGNVRELSNIIERAILLEDSEYISINSLPEQITTKSRTNIIDEKLYKENMIGSSLEEVEKIVIELTLKKNKGHRMKTANDLGISEKGLRNKIKKYKIII